MLKHIGLAGLFLALTSCASTSLDALESGERPTNKSSFEAGMWEAMDRAEADLARSGRVVRDEALNSYINSIVCTLAADHCADIRVYILRDPSFGASMAPNGMALLNTGLILRSSNEAELAHVLGHEIGHYVERHTAERYASLKNGAQFSAFLTASLADIAVVGSYLAFSREQEFAADTLGFDMAVSAGYDGDAASQIWVSLTEETAASENRRRQRRFNSSGFLSTHPLPEDRKNRLAELAGQTPGGSGFSERFFDVTDPFLLEWLSDEVGRRDIGATIVLLDRLEQQRGASGPLSYMRGEAFRVRAGDGDADRAKTAYVKASEHPDAPPETWRQLGDFYYSNGETINAIDAFSLYLEKAPDASDRPLIEGLLNRLEGEKP